MKIKSKSFTLIELLVVIAIIGVLAGIIITSMTSAINAANDARRKADISSLYSSILSQGTKQSYPDLAAEITENSPTELKEFINNYLKSIPTDPKGIYEYFYYGDGSNFAVGAVLEDNTCFIKQTSNIFDTASCTKFKEGGIGLVQNFIILSGGGTYDLSWTIPSSFDISNPSTSTALICLGKAKTDTNIPTNSELLSSGNLVAIINGTNTYHYYASNADYNYYCKAITYNNTTTNPGIVGSNPNIGTDGFYEYTDNELGNSGSGNQNYSSSTPSSSSSTPVAAPPSFAGNTNPGGSYSSNFTISNQRNEDGTGNITLSWIPGNLSTNTIIRRTESTTADPTIAPKTLSDGIEAYNKANTLDSNNNPIDPDAIHTFTDSNLNENKYYCYSAWAYDSLSDTYSNGYVLACSGIPPTNASNLSIYGTSSTINLSWTKGSGDKTMIRRKINTPPESFIDGELIYGDTALSYIDDGSSTSTTLLKNTNYCYSVWSYATTPGVLSKNVISGCSQLSNIGNPTNLTFPNVAYNSMVLNWDIADGATTYIVVRKQDSIPTSRTDGSQVHNNSSTSFMDNDLVVSTEYCYAVWGYDGTSYSETPATGCSTTLATIPDIPTISVIAMSSSINVNYNFPSNAIRTVIERISPTNSWNQTDTNTTSLEDVGLTAGTQYCYKAKSCSTNEDTSCSAYSEQNCATIQIIVNYAMDTGALTANANNTHYFISGIAASGNNITIGPDITTTITFSGDTTIDMSSSGKPAIILSSGSNLTINIQNGVTVTLRGGNASGTTKGFAGINVPTSSVLKVQGLGNLTATGGNAATGVQYYGAGGAGAGIGGNGGTGYVLSDNGYSLPGVKGGNGESAGTVIILSIITAKGGNGANGNSYPSTECTQGSGGTNGGAGTNGGGCSLWYACAPGGGGGGYPAAGIGGGGGASGTGGGSSCSNSSIKCGGGGGGGYAGGGGGGGGNCSRTTAGGGGYNTNGGIGGLNGDGSNTGGAGGAGGAGGNITIVSGVIAIDGKNPDNSGGQASDGSGTSLIKGRLTAGYGSGAGYKGSGNPSYDNGASNGSLTIQ